MSGYKCLKCEEGPFARRHALESHLYECHCGNIYPMKCNICESEFRSMHNLKRHLERMHSSYTQPPSDCFVIRICPYCESECFDYFDLQSHILSKHQQWKFSSKSAKNSAPKNHRVGKKKTVDSFLVPSNDKFVCLIAGCGAKYPNRKLLSSHLRDHNLKNSPKCERCGRYKETGPQSFVGCENADSNNDVTECPCKATHLFECDKSDFCKKAYKAAWLLARHSLSKHENVSSAFECRYCSTQFKSEKSLLEHMKVHFHPKSYHCNDCGDRFNQRSALTRHVATVHNLRRSNFCCVCGLSFSQSGNLKVHVEKVHELKCQKCFGVFRAKDVVELESHVKNCQEKPIYLMEDDFNDVMQEIEIHDI